MKKIEVSKDLCIGCGACVAIDPEHFDFNDEGKSHVISNENIDNENVTNTIESCPTSAIQKVEGPEEKEEEKEEKENCDCEQACTNHCHCCEAEK